MNIIDELNQRVARGQASDHAVMEMSGQTVAEFDADMTAPDPRIAITLTTSAAEILVRLRERAPVFTDADVVTAALNVYEMHLKAGGVPEFSEQPDRWLYTRDACAEYGVKTSTVTLACRQGQIVDAVKTRYGWQFSANALRAWMEQRPGRGRPRKVHDD